MTTTMGSLDLSTLNSLYDETQYFWFESSAQPWGAGAHVTLYPQSEFTTSTHANYLKGQNILMNTDGLSIRNGTLPMMILDNDSLDFNVVDTTNGTYTTTATFTSTGAQIGQSGAAHSVIDTNGQRFYASNGTTQLANIGYGMGTAQSGTDTFAPYYTFGTRLPETTDVYDPTEYYEYGERVIYDDGDFVAEYICVVDIDTPEPFTPEHWQRVIGNHSFANGYQVIASGVNSHAEGMQTKAIGQYAHAEGHRTWARGNISHTEGYETEARGNYSHAEGQNSYASGECSHVEGQNSYASGEYSHAEGYGTHATKHSSHSEGYRTSASGLYSHAQNYYTVANKNNQTAIGRYNIIDTAETESDQKAFIIGNGTSDTNRSNAFTVDWSGNVVATGSITASGFPSGLTTQMHSTSTGSISATSDSGAKTATVTKVGYYPLAISGWYFAGTNLMYQTLYSCRLSSRSDGSATIAYRFYNRSSASYSGTFYFEILWAKI